MQTHRTITLPEAGEKPEGLLNDTSRSVVYIQSSGGNIPWITRPILNKGLDYIEDIMKFIEINKFERLLVDGTGTTEVDKQTAIESAKGKIDGIVEKIDVKEMMLV